jgi:hypothetical protein
MTKVHPVLWGYLVFSVLVVIALTLQHPPSGAPPIINGCFRLIDEGWLSCEQAWSNPLDWWEAGQDI